MILRCFDLVGETRHQDIISISTVREQDHMLQSVKNRLKKFKKSALSSEREPFKKVHGGDRPLS